MLVEIISPTIQLCNCKLMELRETSLLLCQILQNYIPKSEEGSSQERMYDREWGKQHTQFSQFSLEGRGEGRNTPQRKLLTFYFAVGKVTIETKHITLIFFFFPFGTHILCQILETCLNTFGDNIKCHYNSKPSILANHIKMT